MFPRNKTISIVGHSGCGKSTLLELIAGVKEPDSGKIEFQNSHNRLGKIADMQQKDLLLPWLNVEENILLPLKIKGKISIESIEDMQKKASILGIYE